MNSQAKLANHTKLRENNNAKASWRTFETLDQRLDHLDQMFKVVGVRRRQQSHRFRNETEFTSSAESAKRTPRRISKQPDFQLGVPGRLGREFVAELLDERQEHRQRQGTRLDGEQPARVQLPTHRRQHAQIAGAQHLETVVARVESQLQFSTVQQCEPF